MGGIYTKHLDTHSSYGTIIQPGNLNLESQKIIEFMKEMDECQSCKYRTECASVGSRYKRVLTDATYAGLKRQINQVVYSQLAVGKVWGTERHLAKEHENNKNLYGACNNMCKWYDEDDVKNKT